MAVVTVKSTNITNRDSVPRVMNNSAGSGAHLRGFVGQCTVTSGNSTGSTYIFGQIPSNALLRDLLVSSPDIGTTTTMDLGLYRNTADGSAVVDADFFTAAFSLKDGAVSKSSALRGNVATIANAEKRVWELLGLSSDPGYVYDVVGTLVGAADGTGTMCVECSYSI